jgi:hypothetical protein
MMYACIRIHAAHFHMMTLHFYLRSYTLAGCCTVRDYNGTHGDFDLCIHDYGYGDNGNIRYDT